MNAPVRGFRSLLHQALAEIGRDNGHGPRPGGHNIDPLLHYYMVDTEASSFFTAQRKTSKTEMIDVLPPEALKRIDEVVKAAKEQKCKQPLSTIASTDRYILTLDVKAPAKRLNDTKLRSKLIRDGRYTLSEVNELIEACEDTNEPAKTYAVSSILD